MQEHLSPETIAKLLRETKPEIKPPEVRHFQFVVILVDDTNPQEVPAIISLVTSTLVQDHANVSNIAGCLIVALLGVPFPEGDSPEARRKLVDALLREHGDRIKVAHGECAGAVGILGGPERSSYGAVIPAFSAVLKTLLETKVGTAVEIS